MSPYIASPSSLFFGLNSFAFVSVSCLSGYLGSLFQSFDFRLSKSFESIKFLEDFNELIVENIRMGLLVLNDDLSVVYNNPFASRFFKQDLQDQSVHSFCTPLHQSLMACANDKKNEVSIEVEVDKETLGVFIFKLNNELGKFLILFHDVTEVKKLQNELKQKEKLSAVGQLAAGIAHELRNPLTSISGNIQLLRSSDVENWLPENKKLLDVVVKEIDRLNRLISEFMSFVRAENFPKEPLDVNSLIEETWKVFCFQKQKTQMKCVMNLRAKGLVLANSDKLKQVFLNLFLNAFQAMQQSVESSEIKVLTYDDNGWVYIKVIDNGRGMSKRTVDRIFEPFFSEREKGTGLGLAMVHKIIDLHDGKIFVESSLGKGTTFTLSFLNHPVSAPKEERVRQIA